MGRAFVGASGEGAAPLRLFLFSLGGEWFALRREQVRGVLPRDGATPGTARLRLPGSVSSDPAAHLLVVAGPGGRDALMEAERVPGLVELREDALHEVPAFVFPDAAVTVSGVFEWDGGLAALLEPAGLDLRPEAPLAQQLGAIPMYVTFRVGTLALGVPAAAVAEIVPATGVRPLPGMGPALAGVLLGSGGVVGIVDLALLAGVAPTGMRAVMVLGGEPRLGLLVESPDAVPGGYEEPGPEVVDAPLPLLGAIRSADTRFHRVDLDGLRRRLRALPAGRRQRGGEDGDPDSGGR